MNPIPYTVVLGAQWGDEGKGKLVDVLSKDFDIVARATGGANAGHTVYFTEGTETKKFVFHLLPSGILYPQVTCVIGNGLVLHVGSMFEEIEALKVQGYDVEPRVKISDRVALLFDYHKLIDGAQEDSKGGAKVGTTRRGIGPAYSDKINRRGLRLCDLINWDSFVEKYRANVAWHQKVYGFDYDAETELNGLKAVRDRLLAMKVDGAFVLNQAVAAGKKVLVEGANATLLDIDHGTYPFVTSSNPSIGGVFTGTGLNPRYLGESIGIVKAYMTRVGSGPFPTELLDALGDSIREAGGEYGSTTGRPRRCGWFDVPMTKYSVMINGFTALNLTKLDVLDELEEIKVAVAYRLDGKVLESIPASLEDLARVEVDYETLPGWKVSLKEVTTWEALPENAKKYVLRLEELLGCPFKYIGVGQRRDQLLTRV
jgi:adenylosuccinate synthase